MTETDSQSVECGKLLSYFEKWNTKVSSRDLFSAAANGLGTTSEADRL